MAKTKMWLKRVFLALVAIVALCAIYSALFFSFVRVPTNSMKNAILVGDHLICNKSVGKVERGDVLLYQMPSRQSVTYVKRVIGMPGERIRIDADKVFINGNELPERREYIESEGPGSPDPLKTISSEGSGPYTVYYQRSPGEPDQARNGPSTFGVDKEYTIPEGEYFMMGDNRDNSEDSRYYGTVSGRLIVARPLAVYWSSVEGTVRWSRLFSKIK